MKIYEFKNFRLNTVERRLTRDGECLRMTSKMFDVLLMLVERAGEVVTKDELLGSVWQGRIVEESNLAVQISRLRKLLDGVERDCLIGTVDSEGYRFARGVRAARTRPRESAAIKRANRSDLDYVIGHVTTGVIAGLSGAPTGRVSALTA